MKVVLRPCQDGDLRYDHLWFYCPACGERHCIRVNHPNGWGWNGDVEKPTFTPSVLVHGHKRITDDEAKRIMNGEHIELTQIVCHSFVTDGKIQYLSDCSHSMAGQTIDLPDIAEDIFS